MQATTLVDPTPHCPDPAAIWIKQTVDCPMIEQAAKSADAIHLAAQVGRLDIVSIILGLFALLLGFAALYGFWMVRGAALEAARDEARQYLDREAGRLFNEAVRARERKPEKPDLGPKVLNEEAIIEQATELKENGDGTPG